MAFPALAEQKAALPVGVQRGASITGEAEIVPFVQIDQQLMFDRRVSNRSMISACRKVLSAKRNRNRALSMVEDSGMTPHAIRISSIAGDLGSSATMRPSGITRWGTPPTILKLPGFFESAVS